MKKERGLIFAAIFLSIFLSLSFVSATGEWPSFQKDKDLSGIQLTGSYLLNYTSTQGTQEVGIADFKFLHPLIADFNTQRRLIMIENHRNLTIYSPDLILLKKLQLGNDSIAFTTSDYDLDGNTEIEIILKNNDTSVNLTYYEYIPSTLSLTNEKEITIDMLQDTIASRFAIANIICDHFTSSINIDCVFLSGLNSTSNRVLYIFNSTASIQENNLAYSISNFSDYTGLNRAPLNSESKRAGKYGMFFSLSDADNDGYNEINFVYGGGLNNYPIIYSIRKDLSIYINKTDTTAMSLDATIPIEYTTTKVANVWGNSTKEFIYSINSVYFTAGVASYLNIFGDNDAIVNSFGFSNQYFAGAWNDHAVSISDFIVYGTDIYIITAKESEHVEGGIITQLIKRVRLGGAEINNYYGFGYADNMIAKATDLDNDGELEFITPYCIRDINYTNGTMTNLANNTGTNYSYAIPADINKDYISELIVINSTAVYSFESELPTNNFPSITNLFWNTGNPVCVNSSVTYSVDYSDLENDSIYLRVDCYGNLSYLTTSLSTDPSITCNFTELGNYNSQICIKDFYQSTFEECKTHYVTTQLTLCYNTGENAGNQSFFGTSSTANEFGFYSGQFRSGGSHYVSKYFDYSRCEKYKIWYGFCPLIIIVQTGFLAIWNGIFSSFYFFLVFLLVIIILAILIKIYTKK